MGTSQAKIRQIVKGVIRERICPYKKRFIIEGVGLKGKTIVNVDIQPEYERFVSFNLGDWVDFINGSTGDNKVVFFVQWR